MGTIYNQLLVYLVYADEIALLLLGKTDKDITKAFTELETAYLHA